MRQGNGGAVGEAELSPAFWGMGDPEEGADGAPEDGARQKGKEEAGKGGIPGTQVWICCQKIRKVHREGLLSPLCGAGQRIIY